MTPDKCFLVFAHYVTHAKILAYVRDHVRRFCDNCRTLTSTKLKTFKLVLTYTKNVREPWLNDANFKGKAQFIFLCNPQNSLANVCLMKKSKSTATKKVTVCFYNFC